jgi:coniferyl-aldehyde dehydrogenase
MNDMTPPAARSEPPAVRLARLFAAQRAASRAEPAPSVRVRRARLVALRRQIRRYQDVLAQAISADFGFRPAAETRMLDLLGCVLEANHAIARVGRWMRPSRRRTELLFLTNSLRVTYQPKGVVGIIAPWNFPVYLTLGPLIAALAAGNRAMIKMSEATPAANAVLARLIGEVFGEDEVAVVGGELADPAAFAALPFDHLVFTGSPRVGRLVMRSAADNLTPVTLELGGKSPALVLRDYPIADAARRIAHGKSVNGGQICVAPDYALVPRESVEPFVAAAKASFADMYGARFRASPDFTWVASDGHLARLHALLDDARAKGALVIPCADYIPARDGRRMPLHIVVDCRDDMRIMQEELFGPVLPVAPYDSLDDAIGFVNARERPLALYCFSRDAAQQRAVLDRTHSGGVTINDWGWHVVNHDAPFGGSGNSGMGSYHGVEGFRELSHARTVFKRHRLFPIGLFHPPYGALLQNLTLRFFLGRGDPSLRPPASQAPAGDGPRGDASPREST